MAWNIFKRKDRSENTNEKPVNHNIQKRTDKQLDDQQSLSAYAAQLNQEVARKTSHFGERDMTIQNPDILIHPHRMTGGKIEPANDKAEAREEALDECYDEAFENELEDAAEDAWLDYIDNDDDREL